MACILIIDDDDSFREALAEAIRDLGHDVVLANGAQKAFEFINNADATFLDLKMPDMSGIDFLRRARPTGKRKPTAIGLRRLACSTFIASSCRLPWLR